MESALVTHPGIVLGMEKNRVKVQIVTGSACGGCAAKGSCPSKGSSESKETEVLAVADPGLTFSPGERIEVVMITRQGFLAVWWAFVLPILLFVGVILFLGPVIGHETLTALAALGTLGLSWGLLYIFRKKFENDFVFQARRFS